MPDAVVHIGPLPARDLISRFYDRCGLETIGAGRIAVGARVPFDTFDQLLDNMGSRSERFQIIVNHGNTTQGLIMPFARGATHSATGEVIRQLAAAADRGDSTAGQNGTLIDLAARMGTSRDTALRMIQKLATVRSRTPFVEIRGCNLGADLGMLQRYKDAFGALSVSAPDCRMFFFAIRPHRPGRGETMKALIEGRPKTGKTRRRLFEDQIDFSLSAAGSLIIDVRDIDGHTHVDTESFMDRPANASSWAVALNGTWRQAADAVGSSDFVLPVLWDDGESTYHTPMEFGYRSHLARI